MSDFIEEYGGVIVASLMGLIVLGVLFSLFGYSDGYLLKELLHSFLKGSGVQIN